MTLEPSAKRKVNYNQDAVLCRCCTKRIRLNNNGRLRIHVAGKVGSDRCMGSNAEPFDVAPATLVDVKNQIDPESKSTDPTLFSDLP